MLRSVVRLSVQFKLLIVALAAGIMIAGIAWLPHQPTAVLPEISPVVVQVQTEAPGLSGPEVEALVTTPLEKNLFEGIMGVTAVTSDSIPGLSAIYLHFSAGTDLYHARQLVQERLTQSFVLPNVSKPPVMLQPVSSTDNALVIGLSSRHLSLVDLSVLARWVIVPRLLGVAGVADVSTFGQADRQLQVLVDPTRLAASQVTLAQIIETAGDSQLVSPLSYLEGSTPGTGGFLEGSNQRINIRPVLPFGTPANLAQVPVAEDVKVRLGSVAEVVEGHQPLIGDGLVHGGPGLVLVIEKLPGASVPGVTSGIDQALASLRLRQSDVQVDDSLFRPASYVWSSLANLRLALIIAVLLAIAALLALLASLRLAFAGLAGMALATTSAALVLSWLGYTFNALVALGLLLAVAVVTDETVGALVSLRTTLRPGGSAKAVGVAVPDGPVDASAPTIPLRRIPLPSWPERAAETVRTACGELRGALGAATVAVIAAVSPLLFATGPTAAFLRPMAIAFALAVTAAMVVTLTITPALTAVMFAAGPGRREPWNAALARRLGAAYRRWLATALRVPRAALIGIAVLGLAGPAALALTHLNPPQLQDRNLVVQWTGAPGMSLPELDRIAAKLSQELAALPAVSDVGANLGRASSSEQIVDTNSGQIWVTLKPSASYGSSVAAVRGIASGTPGIAATVSSYQGDALAGVLGASGADRGTATGATAEAGADTSSATAAGAGLRVRIYGLDYGELATLARQVRAGLSRLSGVKNASFTVPAQQPTITVAVNLDLAAQYGVKPGDIRREVATLLSGLTAGNFFQDQKVFDVVVLGTPSVRSNLDTVSNLVLDTVNGGHVRLGALAKVSVQPDPVDIKHDATARYLDVTAQVTGTSTGAVIAAAAAVVRGIRFPLEYNASVSAGSTDGTSSRSAFLSYVVAALIGLLLLAQAALRSWRLALIVLAAVLLPVTAGAAVMFGSGQRGSLAAAAGLLAVLAVAVRQAIRVAAAIRHRQGSAAGDGATSGAGSGGGLSSEVVTGGVTAVGGAVLISAMVAILILLPFAVIGSVPGTELTRPAAVVALAGLVAATLVNLLLLPAACLWFGPKTAAGPLDMPGDPTDAGLTPGLA